MIDGLGKNEDSFLIGFVSSALMTKAISIDEAHLWVYNLIKKFDGLPSYIYFLEDATNWESFYKTIGYSVSSRLSKKEFDALRGIAFLRGNRTDEEAITRKAALKALDANPQVAQRFRETFPFIDF